MDIVKRLRTAMNFREQAWQDLAEGAASEIARLRIQLAEEQEMGVLLEWITNLAHGVGKGGDEPPSDAEWEDCLSRCRAAIDDRRLRSSPYDDGSGRIRAASLKEENKALRATLGAAGLWQVRGLSMTIDRLTARIAELEAENQDLKDAFSKDQDRIVRLNSSLAELESDMHMRIRAEYDATVADCWKAKVAELEAQLAEYMGKVGELTGKLHRSEGQLAEAQKKSYSPVFNSDLIDPADMENPGPARHIKLSRKEED